VPIFRTLRNLARNLLLRGRVRREIDEELRGALAALEAEQREAGLSDEEARRAAAVAFGQIDAIREHVGDARAGAALETLVRDLDLGGAHPHMFFHESARRAQKARLADA